MIVPLVAATVLTEVNTRTGSTSEPTPLEPRVIELKVAAVSMAGAVLSAIAMVSADDCMLNAPFLAAAGPRVKPDSVTVTAAVPVGPTPIVRFEWL